jgi:hypothetical protein
MLWIFTAFTHKTLLVMHKNQLFSGGITNAITAQAILVDSDMSS